MTISAKVIFDKVFKDKSGRVIIWQNPNIPLWIWIISVVAGVGIKSGAVHSDMAKLGMAAIFTWSYLEIRTGVSLFRRILGAVVMVVVIYGLFTTK